MEQEELKMEIEERIEWCKQREAMLEKMEHKLYEMKEIAECVRDCVLSPMEFNRFNEQFKTLKQEVRSLDQQFRSKIY